MNDAPFSVRVVIALVVGGALLALSALLLSGFGEDIARRVNDRPGPDVKHGAGFHALRRLVADMDRLAPPDIGTHAVLVLTPDARARPEDIRAILRERETMTEDEGVAHPTLIILPKWRVERIGASPDRVRGTEWDWQAAARMVPVRRAAIRQNRAARTAPLPDSGFEGLPGFHGPPSLQSVNGDTIEPLIADPARDAVLARIGVTDTFILADPDLLNNRGMSSADNAVAALAMLREIDPTGAGHAAFDTSLHYRPGDRNLVRLLFTPPFLAVTLALIVAAAMAGMAAANRFGPVRREGRAVAPGKRALADNVARLTRLAGRTAQAGPRHADALLDMLRARLGIPAREREATIARLDRMGHAPYAPLDAALRSARSEAELVAAANRIHDWRKEMGA